MDFFGYISIVLIWRTFWNAYDYFVFEYEDHPGRLVIVTHFVSFIFVSMFGITSALYGPAGADSNPSTIETQKKPKELEKIIDIDIHFDSSTFVY